MIVLWLLLAASASPWSSLARTDLAFARDAIRDNHPGPVDPEAPGFNKQLEEAFAAADARGRAATSFEGYAASLRSFVAAFHDGHMGADIDLARLSCQWPGFLVAFRHARYVVRNVGADEGLPRVGDHVLSCDGRPLRDWMRQDVFPFSAGAKEEVEASWVRLASQVLVDAGNPFRARASSCVIESEGKTREITLEWRPIEQALLESRARSAAFGAAPAAALRALGDDAVWASIPSFAPDDTGEALLHRMIAEAPSWRGKRLIVLDVRGNAGGSSLWGQDLLRALYGTVLEGPDSGTYVEWRVSADNRRHVAGLVSVLTRQFGADDPSVGWARKVAAGLHGALRLGEALYREADAAPATRDEARPPDPTALASRVFLVTDGRCSSACADFVDAALRYPNVVHVGAATDADSPYTEIRPVSLPSGIATLNLATKVYRNRPRTGRPFVPSHLFPGELGDTPALEAWILDLARRTDP
jgi:hypothetical protein